MLATNCGDGWRENVCIPPFVGKPESERNGQPSVFETRKKSIWSEKQKFQLKSQHTKNLRLQFFLLEMIWKYAHFLAISLIYRAEQKNSQQPERQKKFHFSLHIRFVWRPRCEMLNFLWIVQRPVERSVFFFFYVLNSFIQLALVLSCK